MIIIIIIIINNNSNEDYSKTVNEQRCSTLDPTRSLNQSKKIKIELNLKRLLQRLIKQREKG